MPPWLSAQLATVYAGAFLNRLGGAALLFLVLFLTRRGYSPAEAGAAVSVYGAGNVVAALGGGVLADRLGPRATIIVSMFTGGATLLAIPAAPALWLIMALSFAAGAGLELYRPASAALISSLTEPAQRVGAFAMYRLAMNAGVAGAGILGGLIAAQSFTYVFVLDAATCFLFGLIALTLIRTPPDAAVPIKRASVDRRKPGRLAGLVRGHTALLVYLLGSTMLCTVFSQAQVTLPLRVRDLGLSPRDFGALMSINGALILVIQMPLVPLLRRGNAVATIAVGYLLVGLGFMATGWATGMPVLVATVVVWTLGEIVFAPVAAAYVAGMAPAHQRGRYQGASSFTYALGLLLAPLLGPAIYDQVAARARTCVRGDRRHRSGTRRRQFPARRATRR